MNIPENLKDHILDSIAEGVFAVDKNFRLIFFNKAAEKITGRKKEEVLGKLCKQVFKSEFCFTDCPIAAVLKSSNNLYEIESRVQTNYAAGTKPIKLNAAVLYNNNNEPDGGIVSFTDISPLEQMEYNLLKETQFDGMIGHSSQMKQVFELIKEIAGCDAPVFIRGESGTGKELVANAIQKLSCRRDLPYIKINCSVFPQNLLASELFGHVKGSFTDAVKDRPGRFELADKGTIFLDEIGEIPLRTQVQLLRVLQEGTFEKIGESLTRHTDVRIITATNINIREALKKGLFREDLYYRLNVIPIELPPLRERKEDIIPLANYFLKQFSIYYKKEISRIEDRAMEILLNYNWPGNVRELENILEYAFVRTADKSVLEVSKLPQITSAKSAAAKKKVIYDEESESSDRCRLTGMLEENRWNKEKTARALGISRTTLWRKMKKFGLSD